MRKRIMHLVVGFFLLTGSTFAAPGTVAEVAPEGVSQTAALTLESAVAIALAKNPTVRAAREGVKVAEEAGGEVRAAYYPELSFTTGYTRWERHAFLPSGLVGRGIPEVIGPTDDWYTGLRARYTLFDSGRRRAELQAALARVGAAERETAKTQQDLVLLVHQAYFGLAATLEIEAVAHKKLERAEDHLRLARARKEAGAVPQADVVRAQVDVADAKLVLEQTLSAVRVAQGNLNTALGLSAETPLEIDAQPPDVAPPSALSIRDVMESAVQDRPEIQAARKRVEAATKRITAARSAFAPTVKAEGSFGWRDSDFLPHDKDWTAGISMELPLFTGFARKHRVNRTKAELSAEEAALEALTLAVRREVWSAFSRLKESYERIRAAEPMVRDARESVRLAQERYQAGAGTITDLLDSESALARANAIHVEAAWDYQTAKSVFNRATGQLAR